MKTYLLYDERFMEDEDAATILESFEAKDDEQAIAFAQKTVTQNGFAATVTDGESRYLTFLLPKQISVPNLRTRPGANREEVRHT